MAIPAAATGNLRILAAHRGMVGSSSSSLSPCVGAGLAVAAGAARLAMAAPHASRMSSPALPGLRHNASTAATGNIIGVRALHTAGPRRLTNKSHTITSTLPNNNNTTTVAAAIGSPATNHKSQHHIQHTPASLTQARWSSHSPLGSKRKMSETPPKRVTLQTLRSMHKRGEPITMVTAHDFPSAHVADHAGIDMILVGDSLAMVALGMEDTSEVVLDEMLLHCRSVSRGAQTPFIVGDLPMGSYEVSPEEALRSSIRVIKEGRVHGIKLEGGAEIAPSISRIATAGIPVLAHIGLTPQRQHSLGGFRVQAKSIAAALKLIEDAKAVQEAGAFGVVIEAVPSEVATHITNMLDIPTIGIGAGNGTSGQVLVQVDMCGYYPPGRSLPKFAKKYGDLWTEASKALESYREEVKSREFPSTEYTYPMPQEALEEFKKHAESQK